MKGPGYLAVAIQPGPDTDPESFHDWYNTEHGPLRLRLPFITTGYRYRAVDGGKPEWIAVYNVSDLSWLESRIYTRLREERSVREKKVMGSFDSLDRKIYQTFLTVGNVKGPAPVQMIETLIIEKSNLDEVRQWLEKEYIPFISDVPGWRRTRCFQTLVGGLEGLPPAHQVEIILVHDFEKDSGLKDVSWTSKPQLIVSRQCREWQHYLTFDSLKEPPSTVITTDGAELKYQLDGNSYDPVVVFVNPILTTYHIWDEITKMLTTTGIGGKRFRVLRYNARGYSQQAERSNPTSFDILADDLEYLLQRLNIAKAYAVVGCSMGGVTSINFAIRHPAMVDRFVACDCNVASSPANNTAWNERVELARREGMEKLADVTVKRWFMEPNHQSANAKKAQVMVTKANFDGFVQNAGALCNYDLKDHLPKIETPGLLLAGECDGKLPEAMQKFGIPNTIFKSVPKAGHLPMMENPEAFEQLLNGFLGGALKHSL
ncbi:alpha/beta-hydrolase [Piedraia hortae CBS 480.64]|uniref:Alpha/beta-hydrolase n=1 Tax=Piedraia hortae CBS 480.64 TaxID=1314780 RepID=A0A6A7C054_9PEZI|nr:alpha/beta-hydrolase [Piedraia hortae CBS 480.64]